MHYSSGLIVRPKPYHGITQGSGTAGSHLFKAGREGTDWALRSTLNNCCCCALKLLLLPATSGVSCASPFATLKRCFSMPSTPAKVGGLRGGGAGGGEHGRGVISGLSSSKLRLPAFCCCCSGVKGFLLRRGLGWVLLVQDSCDE